MSRRFLLVVIVTIALSARAQGAPTRMLGCEDPDVMSKALKGISNSDWNDISETSLPSMWPMEISPADCNAGACQTVWSQDRVIGNECECCELFHFQVDRNDQGGLIKERLEGIVIHYSATDRGEILMAAKKLARALGLSGSDTATVGRQPQQQFYWYVDSGKQKEIALLEVQVTHQRLMWKVSFFFSRQAA